MHRYLFLLAVISQIAGAAWPEVKVKIDFKKPNPVTIETPVGTFSPPGPVPPIPSTSPVSHVPLPGPMTNVNLVAPFVLPPMPYDFPSLMPSPEEVWKKHVQVQDAIHDIVTFGEFGRQRDRERAAAAEREALAKRDGSAETLQQKKRDLQESISQARANVADWEDLLSVGPAAVQQLLNLSTAAQNELKARAQLAASARAAKNANDDASASLEMISRVLAPSRSTEDADKMLARVTASWNMSKSVIIGLAKNANVDEGRLLSAIISQADEGSLQQFVTAAGKVQAYFDGLLSVAQEKLQSAKAKLENYERQMAALN